MTMKTKITFITSALVILLGLSACGGGNAISGHYVAEFQGTTMEFDFLDDSKVIFAMTEEGVRETMDCTYTSGETRISVSCPGSSGIAITRAGSDLEADMGGMVVRFKKS